MKNTKPIKLDTILFFPYISMDIIDKIQYIRPIKYENMTKFIDIVF